jgi:hypothetical protein
MIFLNEKGGVLAALRLNAHGTYPQHPLSPLNYRDGIIGAGLINLALPIAPLGWSKNTRLFKDSSV